MRPVCFIVIFILFFGAVQGQKQGIKGKVFWVDNTQVPDPDQRPDPENGVSREVLVYTATYLKDVKQSEGFFTEVSTQLVMSATSDDDGSFKIKLPPGNYSVFVREPNGLFANLFDRQNQINPVVVQPKRYTWVTITIDYLATN